LRLATCAGLAVKVTAEAEDLGGHSGMEVWDAQLPVVMVVL
jgi:hypothetical protein